MLDAIGNFSGYLAPRQLLRELVLVAQFTRLWFQRSSGGGLVRIYGDALGKSARCHILSGPDEISRQECIGAHVSLKHGSTAVLQSAAALGTQTAAAAANGTD